MTKQERRDLLWGLLLLAFLVAILLLVSDQWVSVKR